MSPFTFFPPEAASGARPVDTAFFWILLMAGFICLLLFVLIVVFSVRYRRGSGARRGPLPDMISREFEVGWTIATLFVAIFLFWWFVGGIGAPTASTKNALEIHVVARQWMWKVQHAGGASEIDELHLPVNTPVHLIMTSEDVIHSFYVPAFRVKQDVLPGRPSELLFTPTEIGTYNLLCAEYCGTQHSHMTGHVVVMAETAYTAWESRQPHGNSLSRQGAAIFTTLGCAACHAGASNLHAPKLDGLFHSKVALADGRTVTVDETYLRRAILEPRADIVAGYEPIMPGYDGLISPADLVSLLAYLESLPATESQP
ncbi:MAG TPA: cytochrome c oxidase subunit II [Dongiaceae bacterium]